MDLNPVSTDATAFHPLTTVTGASGDLKLFEQVGISFLHGWLVDPDSPESPVFRRVQDYDAAVCVIAEADHLTNGIFVYYSSSRTSPCSRPRTIHRCTSI
jgi:hypothetical protein